MSRLKVFVASAFALCAPFAGAHHLWLQVEAGGKQGAIFVADDPAKARVPMAVKPGKSTSMLRWNVGELSEGDDGKSLVAEVLKPAAAVQLTYGIHGPDLITWYAKGCQTAKDAEKPLGLDYEFTARQTGTNLTFRLTAKKKPVPNCRVEVFGNGIPYAKIWKTDGKGNLVVPFAQGGRMYVAAEIKIDQVGTFQGQNFRGRLEMPCLTFSVPKG